MFKFIYKSIETLPKLAWLADVDYNNETVKVICGDYVECRDKFFVAGVWNGEFEDADFDKSDVFYGSGAKINDESVEFVTPSHNLERLVTFEGKNHISVSNSIAFLMAYENLSLDKKENQYESILCSMLDGYDKMNYSVPMAEGKNCKQYIVCSVVVSSKGEISVIRRGKPQPFKDYEDYYNRLVESTRMAKENGTSAQRKNKKYSMVTTISRGYDSPACSAVARVVGCDTAVSVSGGVFELDNGREIAEKLGYTNIIGREHSLYRDKKGLVDAEYIANGEIGPGIQLNIFEDIFAGNMVVIGSRGTYWDIEHDLTEELEMVGYYNFEVGISWTENALKNGYISVPLPAFGARVCNSIKKISASEEMKNWSIGGSYDKPIPRRIVESFGVDRQMFGQKKMGAAFSLNHDTFSLLKHKMTYSGYSEFEKYCKNNAVPQKNVKWVCNYVKYFRENSPLYLNYIFAKLKINKRLLSKATRTGNPGAPCKLFFWSISVMKERYGNSLNEVKN